MPSKKPKRKSPVTAVRHATSSSHRATQKTISTFHTLLKRQAYLRRQTHPSDGSDSDAIKRELISLQDQIDQLGGLSTYQEASILGQSSERGGDSARVLISWLKDEGIHSRRLLEIGALTPDNYASCSSWIANVPIDLHSQHPDILEQDFFARPLPEKDSERFDVISCSLVLNFVPEPRARGRMLQLIHAHLRPSPTSRLFLVLPLPCLTNSRYCTIEWLISIMSEVGFELIKERSKAEGKVGYWLWAWRKPKKREASSENLGKKRILNDGPKRNNFAILLEGATT